MDEAQNPELAAALFELHQYLSDRIAPLMFADSLELLMDCPPEVVAGEIGAWTAGQYTGVGQPIPVSDYLFHAFRKIHRLGELELVSGRVLDAFLKDLTETVLERCPEEDRDLLRGNLSRLGQSRTGPPPAVDVLYRQPESRPDATSAPLASRPSAPPLPVGSGPGVVVPATVPADLSHGIRRLNVLLERLARTAVAAPGGAGATSEARQELVSEAVLTATSGASNARELDQHLDELRRLGLPTQMDQLFALLAESLPGWLAPQQEGQDARPPLAGPAEAMYRLVALAPDMAEATRRYRELAHAAIRQFNEGLLARAAAMVDVAERLAQDRKVPPPAVEAVRQGSYGYLDEERLRRFAESPDKHSILRRILGFFTPLSPEGLLHELRYEERHDRRRYLLSLIEAQGGPARAAALQRLQELVAVSDEPDPFFVRNLIYLLRTIPRTAEDPAEPDVEAITRAARPRRHPSLIKEGITCLGKLKGNRAESALLAYLRTFEGMLLRPESAAYSKEEVTQLLERTVSALARCGTRTAVRAVVEHGLKDQAALGATRARLLELGSLDLAGHVESTARLVSALREELPRGVMGRLLQKRKVEGLAHLVASLAGTSDPHVQALLGEVATRFPAEDFGRAAAKAVGDMAQRSGPRPPAPVSLSGDLELFGLPTLLQSVADIHASGTLTLFDQAGRVLSVITLNKGRVAGCQTGPLRDQEALWQLFEKPLPGRFAFVGHRQEQAPAAARSALEITPLILEGLRRHDEFRRARALAPDAVVLRPATSGPPPAAGDVDEALAEALWHRVTTGATPLECEAEMPVDSFRVRRLLAQWVEQGALATG